MQLCLWVGGYASQANFYRKFLTIKTSYFRDKRVAFLKNKRISPDAVSCE
jgi:hypothetical protein